MRLERQCRVGYVFLTVLEVLVLAVASIAAQIHDWLLLAGAISGFMLVNRTIYRWVRRHP